MKIRAVIFDVYGTLMQVGPAPANADELWRELFQEAFRSPPPTSRLEFSIACNRSIMMRHKAAHARGIAKPEILWSSIVAEVLPGFAKLKTEVQNDFIFRQIQLGRTISLMPGLAPTLRWLADKRCVLGIASNAQAYTLRELDTLLKPGGLNLSIFSADLCVWSFQHGFSKPDPHIFQIVRARLEARRINPNEALVVGDRLDNDVAPAQAQGFRTWHLNSARTEKHAGTAAQLREFLVHSI